MVYAFKESVYLAQILLLQISPSYNDIYMISFLFTWFV